jgi:sulfhydrogenase subunit beta (sulfur reductase)
VHATVLAPATRLWLDVTSLDALLAALKRRGYTLIGPRVGGTAIGYQQIDTVDDLPRGWESIQAGGHYRLRRRDDDAVFGFGPACESLKRYLHPPNELLLRAHRDTGTLQFEPMEPEAPKLAIIGVRACELEAIARLDRVFLQGPYVDPSYQARRANLFLLAANCVDPGDTCFCASMKTGPRATSLFDLSVTEIGSGQFVTEVGSTLGGSMLEEVECRKASSAEATEADALLHAAAARMGRDVDLDGLSLDLADVLEHPEWDEVARRCLACANCTMLCPTCFCHTIEDRTNLAGDEVERRRRWDTCFTNEFSYIHGGSIRPSVRARYRQWLLHKFSNWVEQFGTYGCVGCGRCITWCPAAIDVTEEIKRLRG